jgi:hypothetical protein
MSFGWVAGAIRGRALARRCLGDEGVAALVAKASLADALAFLTTSSYGHTVRMDLDVAGAQRAVAETSLWHLRVLAGWIPPKGVRSLRAIAGWFELLNLESHAWAMASRERWNEVPLPLGALATIWPRAIETTTLHGLRGVLAHSNWGDPGGDELPEILLGLRLGWAGALRAVVAGAREWADGALTLALAKELFAAARLPERRKLPRVPELGTTWSKATHLATFRDAVPASGRWVLSDVGQPSDLWRAERSWWIRVDRDATRLLARPALDETVVIAAATLLLTDCWRTQAALEQAARGQTRKEEVRVGA